MRIRCSQAQLLNGINTVSKAVPTKTSMTILECILFTADENGIKLTANDMELGIETYIEGIVEAAGTVAVEANTISKLIKSYSNDDFIIWYEMLQDVEPEVFRKAIIDLCKERSYMPTIHDILDKIKNMLGDYEYFYDVNGRFIFQKQQAYKSTNKILTEDKQNIIVDYDYKDIDFTFNDLSLITSLSNNVQINNLKNDLFQNENDIKTEHQKMFEEQGIKTKYLHAKLQ